MKLILANNNIKEVLKGDKTVHKKSQHFLLYLVPTYPIWPHQCSILIYVQEAASIIGVFLEEKINFILHGLICHRLKHFWQQENNWNIHLNY